MARFKVVYTPESLLEIKRIVEWYSDIDIDLGKRFKQNLLEEIAAVKRNPLSRSYRYDKVRFAVVKKFPYAAHYIIDEKNHLIKIHAVLGFSQDSGSDWKMRF